ncbi:MAG: nuclear transport factor 2 family protein [Gammaproteobacteria bacterium]
MKNVATLLELQAVIAEYWAAVDRVPDVRRSATSFYMDAGEMELGSMLVSGREKLEAFFVARNEREIANRRTTRHLAGNFRIQDESADRATVVTLVMVYSGVGNWPLQSAPPSAVGDFSFRCVRDAARGWLFEKVSGTSVFVGEGAPSFAR